MYDRTVLASLHEERVAQALGTTRQYEAPRSALGRWALRTRQAGQQATAQALVGLATRIAPTGAVPTPRTPAPVQ